MFTPPFCPNKSCSCHEHPPASSWCYPKGSHKTKCFGIVTRFRCRTCGHTFSVQTFSVDYYAKRQIDYRLLERRCSSSMSVRSLARDIGCSPGSVLNRLDRLARQALACHARLRPKASTDEDITIDGFVSFDRSQYFPNNITISIASGSRFALSCSHATLRRSGSMRPVQKKRRDLLYAGVSFEKRALERSFSELLDSLARERPPRTGKPLILITDEKIEYARSIAKHRLFLDQDGDHRLVHLTVNSGLPRTAANPLFPSNYLDREIRKDQAAHRRETTCFARNAANGMSRMAVYLCWHNYGKRYLAKWPVKRNECHGEMAGIAAADIESGRAKMFAERAFLSLEKLDAMEQRVWMKLVRTVGMAAPSYLPGYAFA